MHIQPWQWATVAAIWFVFLPAAVLIARLPPSPRRLAKAASRLGIEFYLTPSEAAVHAAQRLINDLTAAQVLTVLWTARANVDKTTVELCAARVILPNRPGRSIDKRRAKPRLITIAAVPAPPTWPASSFSRLTSRRRRSRRDDPPTIAEPTDLAQTRLSNTDLARAWRARARDDAFIMMFLTGSAPAVLLSRRTRTPLTFRIAHARLALIYPGIPPSRFLFHLAHWPAELLRSAPPGLDKWQPK